MTSSNSNYLAKTPFPNSITFGIWMWGGALSLHNRCPFKSQKPNLVPGPGNLTNTAASRGTRQSLGMAARGNQALSHHFHHRYLKCLYLAQRTCPIHATKHHQIYLKASSFRALLILCYTTRLQNARGMVLVVYCAKATATYLNNGSISL